MSASGGDPSVLEQILARLTSLIETRSGNIVPEGQQPYLEKLLRERAVKQGFRDLDLYVRALEYDRLDGEWDELLSQITIKESFLFRIPEQFRALEQVIIPRLMRGRPPTKALRAWSAGCARGEEPATLAVVLSESFHLAHREWTILATDLDTAALAEARRMEFGQRAMGQVPAELLERHFDRRGDLHVLQPRLRERVDFRAFNLISSPDGDLGGPFDLIFLRNVLIYFQPEQQRRVIADMLNRLSPEGYLFLGHSESMWQLSNAFETIELDGCFAYRPLDGGKRVQPLPKRLTASPTTPKPTPPSAMPTPPPPISTPTRHNAPPSTAPRSPAEILADAAGALRENRPADAHALLDELLAAHRTDAAGHALLGLVHDLADRGDDAVAAYLAALFLKPDLVQARFLLACRLENLGWNERARSEYRQIVRGLDRADHLDAVLTDLFPDREQITQRSRRALERLHGEAPDSAL